MSPRAVVRFSTSCSLARTKVAGTPSTFTNVTVRPRRSRLNRRSRCVVVALGDRAAVGLVVGAMEDVAAAQERHRLDLAPVEPAEQLRPARERDADGVLVRSQPADLAQRGERAVVGAQEW